MVVGVSGELSALLQQAEELHEALLKAHGGHPWSLASRNFHSAENLMRAVLELLRCVAGGRHDPADYLREKIDKALRQFELKVVKRPRPRNMGQGEAPNQDPYRPGF